MWLIGSISILKANNKKCGGKIFSSGLSSIDCALTCEKIDESTGDIATSVEFIGEASSQLNSLMFPIIASIGIIVALQITIIARRR